MEEKKEEKWPDWGELDPEDIEELEKWFDLSEIDR